MKINSSYLKFVFFVTLGTIVVSEILIYAQLTLFQSDMADEVAYRLGFWSSLIGGFIIASLVYYYFNMSQVQKSTLQDTLELEQFRYQSILKNTADGIHLIDEAGNLIEYSNAFQRMLGYSDEEMSSLNVRDWDSGIEPDALLATVQALIKESQTFVTQHQRKDGTVYDVEISANGVTLDGKNYLYSSARDITHLRLQEEEINSVFSSANAIIAFIAPDGTMTRMNRYAEAFTGHTQEEVASKPYFWAKFLPDEVRNSVEAIIAQAQKGQITEHYQNPWIDKHGQARMIEWSNQLVLNDDGSMKFIFTIGIDIQDKIVAEQALMEQQKQFETIFKYSKDGIAILDLESNFIDFNDAYLEMTGYAKEELLSRSCINMSIPKDISRAEAAIAEVLEQGYVKNFEKSCFHKDGSIFSINMSMVKMPDDERILISTKDVTEEKQNRERIDTLLHEQESLLMLFDKGDSVLFRWNNDEHWSIDHVSNNVENLLGYNKEQFMESKIVYADCIYSEDLDRVFKEVQEGSSKEENFFRHEPYRIVTQEGDVKWVLDHTVLVKDEQGNITHYLGYIIDFTDQYTIQEQLTELNHHLEQKVEQEVSERMRSNMLFKQFIDASSNQKFLIDTEYRYRLVNKEYCTFFGKSYEEFIGKRVDEVSEESKARFESSSKPFYDRVLKGETINISVPFEKDAQLLHFDINMTPFMPNGEIEGVMVISRDITKEYNLEQEQLKSEELLRQQSKLASMGEMIGAIAHQWRQPLNVVSTSIQNLTYDYEDGLVDEKFIEQFVSKNKKTITFMSQTIDDFRSFFRTDKEKHEFDLLDAVQSVIQMQDAQLAHHQIELEMLGESCNYFGLKSELQQVILNLVNNAKDAIVENEIAEGLITIKVSDHKIVIMDNAGGIPQEIIDRIFEPYFTTKEEGKGTGMGLYLSKTIIEQNLRGTLSVHNEQHGACFTIDLSQKVDDD
jgi:PAS domain S-box-containing protein